MADGTEVGTAYVSILPSTAGFGAKLQSQITGQANLVGQRTGQALGAGITGQASGIATKVAGMFAAVGAARFLKGSIAEAEDAARVGRLTAAVIKSTGGAANVTAAELESLAGSLSKVAGVDDELVQSGANVLLTFTRVRNEAGKGNDVFDQAAQSALDMSAALGGDLQGSVLQLGKALNDPVKGMTALTRSGVSFTEQQKEQIKALAQSGDLLGAQKIILAEVNKEFGGAAAANATATARLGVAFGNLQESIGTALLPAVNALAGGLTDALGIFNELPGPIRTTAVALAGLGAASLALALLTPRVRAAKLELQGLSIAGVSAGSALGFLGKVGAVGAVVGGVTLALGALGRQMTNLAKGPAASVSDMAIALANLGENGAVTGELVDQFGGNLAGLGKTLNQFTTPKIVQTLALLNPNLQDAKRDVKAVDQALAELVTNGRPELAAAAIAQLVSAIRAEGKDPALFTGRLDQYDAALGGLNLQARLTGGGIDELGNVVAGTAGDVQEGTDAWNEFRDGLEDILATDWSKEIGSNFESALNPLEKFTFSTGKNVGELRTQLTDAQADLNKATGDLAKLQGTGTSASIARIRGQAGDIDAARAAVDTATRKFNETKALLAEAQRSPLGKIGENLESNLTGLTSWLGNFEKLSTGGHESLARHLASLGPEAADAMAEAVGASPKQLDKLQTMWDTADAKMGELVSGQFELNVAQAAKPGDTLAEIITARYQETLVPKLTQATLAALNAATTAILDAQVAAAAPPPTKPTPLGPTVVAPPGVGDVSPEEYAFRTRGWGGTPAGGGVTIQTTVNAQTNASAHDIATEVVDVAAWRLAPAGGRNMP